MYVDLNEFWTELPTHRYCYLFHRQRVIKLLLLFPVMLMSLTFHVTLPWLEIEHYKHR